MIKRRFIQAFLFFAAIVFSNPVLACTQLDESTTFCFDGTHWAAADMSDVHIAPSTDFGSVWVQSPNDILRLILQWDRTPERFSRQVFEYYAVEQPPYPGCETHSVTDTCLGVDYLHVPSAYQDLSDGTVQAHRITYPGAPFIRDRFNGKTILWSLHAEVDADAYVTTIAFHTNELTPAHLEALRSAVEAIRLGPEERPL